MTSIVSFDPAPLGGLDPAHLQPQLDIATGPAVRFEVVDVEEVLRPNRPLRVRQIALAGDGDVLSDIYRKRVINRGASAFEWGVNFDNAKLGG